MCLLRFRYDTVSVLYDRWCFQYDPACVCSATVAVRYGSGKILLVGVLGGLRFGRSWSARPSLEKKSQIWDWRPCFGLLPEHTPEKQKLGQKTQGSKFLFVAGFGWPVCVCDNSVERPSPEKKQSQIWGLASAFWPAPGAHAQIRKKNKVKSGAWRLRFGPLPIRTPESRKRTKSHLGLGVCVSARSRSACPNLVKKKEVTSGGWRLRFGLLPERTPESGKKTKSNLGVGIWKKNEVKSEGRHLRFGPLPECAPESEKKQSQIWGLASAFWPAPRAHV
jgi:hypothetical protein